MYLGQSGAQNEAKVQKLDFYHSGVESGTGRRWDLFVVEKSQRPLSLGPTPPDSNSGTKYCLSLFWKKNDWINILFVAVSLIVHLVILPITILVVANILGCRQHLGCRRHHPPKLADGGLLLLSGLLDSLPVASESVAFKIMFFLNVIHYRDLLNWICCFKGAYLMQIILFGGEHLIQILIYLEGYISVRFFVSRGHVWAKS